MPRLPEIDVIFGSHTHHYFEHGEINNDTDDNMESMVIILERLI